MWGCLSLRGTGEHNGKQVDVAPNRRQWGKGRIEKHVWAFKRCQKLWFLFCNAISLSGDANWEQHQRSGSVRTRCKRYLGIIVSAVGATSRQRSARLSLNGKEVGWRWVS
jgi:hypothetical protein